MFSLIVVVVDDMVVEVDNSFVENMEVVAVVVDADSVAAAVNTVVDNVRWVVVEFRRRKA